MIRQFVPVVLLVTGVLLFTACDSDDGGPPTIDGDLVVSIEGPPGTEGQLTTTFFDGGRQSSRSETDVTIPSSGEFRQDVEDGHDGVRLEVRVPRGTSIVLTLLSDGQEFAVDDQPEGTLDRDVYEVEVGDVPSTPTPDARR